MRRTRTRIATPVGCWLSPALLVCCSSWAAAQTVQLPSFSAFGVDTTVSAPDRGSVSLGGVGRSSRGSTAFGPALGPRRAFGRSTSASQVGVRATIHDFEAHDKALLKAAGEKDEVGPVESPHAHRIAKAGESSAGQAPAGSLADARRAHAADVAARDAEARRKISLARKAAAKGKPTVAKMLLKSAARDASDDLKRQIRREIASLPSDAKLSASRRHKPPQDEGEVAREF